MKHVVFLVGSYYPYYSAVGKCIGNIACEFEKKYKVTVICEKNVINQSDNDVLNTQSIIRVTTKMNSNRIEIDSKVKESYGIRRCFWRAKLLFSKLERYAKTLRFKSVCDFNLVNSYIEGLNQITDTIDVIIPTCVPFESVVAALQYHSLKPHIQIIPYLFDLFAENVNINRGKFLMKIHLKSNIQFERQMFEISTCVFHVANWTKHIATYFPEYKNKTVEVEHPLFVSKEKKLASNNDGKIHIVYTGVLDLAVRDPKRTLEVLSQVKDDDICFDFYSYGSAENIVRKFSECCNAIVSHGQVNSAEAECAIQSANILLSIGNTGNTSQTPSKLIEYIASGKPIIHFTQSDDDTSMSLLNLYPFAKIVNLSQSVDYSDLNKFIRNNSHVTLNFEEIKRTFRNADPEYIATRIHDKFREGGG